MSEKMRAPTEAWDWMLKAMASTQASVGDRYVPVCVVCVQIADDDRGELSVDLDKDHLLLWPAAFPTELRGSTLETCAAPYRVNRVLRSKCDINKPGEPGEIQ